MLHARFNSPEIYSAKSMNAPTYIAVVNVKDATPRRLNPIFPYFTDLFCPYEAHSILWWRDVRIALFLMCLRRDSGQYRVNDRTVVVIARKSTQLSYTIHS